MDNKTDGKVFWETKDGDRRLMVSWLAKKGETRTPVPQVEAKIIPLMLKMNVDETPVKFDLVSGNPRNIEFVDNQAAEEARKKVDEQAALQKKNTEESNKSTAFVQEENIVVKRLIDTNYQKEFHNPYNFVPAVPRGKVTGELSDREPCGHDRFVGDKFSGKLTVKMTVKTPLAALDTARVEMQKDHKKFPVCVDAEGKPFINPTAVKGMLRSAYEAVTNSRMSVFTKHEDRLAFRREAQSPIPVIVIKDGENYFVKPLEYQKIDNQLMNHVAKLPRYEKNSRKNDKGESFAALTYCDGTLPQHEDSVWVRYKKIKAGAEVQEIKLRKDGDNLEGWKAGWVCVTGANINGKRFERVFLDTPKAQTISVNKELWEELIRNYQEIHQKELEKRSKDGKKPTDYLGDTPGQTAWSRHIYDKNAVELKDGTLCYAEIGNGIVKSIFPVMISRQLFEKSPADLLNENLKSVADINELSPADRVFGCVIQNSKDKKKANAYRGQVRVGAVVLSEDSAKKPLDQITHKFEKSNGESNWLPMNILGQPKPQQGRFYVAETENGEAQKYQWKNENAGYIKGRGLRGRKVYPHHADLPKDYWFEEKNIDFGNNNNLKSGNQFREYLRPPGAKQQNNQNRSIEGWIKPDTKFEFDIHFTNLSEIELGALIWLLQMNEEGENKFFHRFGGGKPFGFGSVKLDLDEARSDIRTGKELAKQRYSSLNDDTPKCEDVRTNFVEKFVNAYQTAGYEKIIESFKSACKGFDDNKPIHYPRTTEEPNSEGKNFDWFVANTKGRKLSLPNLSDEIGLPRKP